MKQLYTLTLMLLDGLAHSQFCGNSGPGVCTPQYYVADASETNYAINYDLATVKIIVIRGS